MYLPYSTVVLYSTDIEGVDLDFSTQQHDSIGWVKLSLKFLQIDPKRFCQVATEFKKKNFI